MELPEGLKHHPNTGMTIDINTYSNYFSSIFAGKQIVANNAFEIIQTKF